MKKITISIFFIVLLSMDAKSNDVIIMFGDSITASQNFNPDTSIKVIGGARVGATVSSLEKSLNESGRNVIVVNYGSSGTTSRGGAQRIEATINEVKANYPFYKYHIAILYGVNDRRNRVFPDETKSNFDKMIEVSLKHGVTPIIGTILPTTYFDVSPYNQSIFESIRGKNVFLVEHNKAWGEDLSNLADGLHPNLDGYIFIANTWLPIIKEIITIKKTRKVSLSPVLNLLLINN